ncbi:hypothetical protein CTA1_3139 [Colletotrichum tanaceti]|uniref:Uncharacterized protein n=1 Tax=Colletotrichum tanaceti TaxID=1306861 RepID=A0A4U6XVQ9_9PEZI|nr:hypothetical protein CTA1_3139 [Colletotrichum tanaceti]
MSDDNDHDADANNTNARDHAAWSESPSPTTFPSIETSHHPRDGFSALRFSVSISKAALRQPTTGLELDNTGGDDDDDNDNDGHDNDADDTDDDEHAEFLLQPIELCFHEPFVPAPGRPLSLHFENPDGVALYKAAPTVLTPTPPRYIVEYNPVLLCPTNQHGVEPNEHKNNKVSGGWQRGLMTVALPRPCPTVGLALTRILSSAVAASPLAVIVALLCLLLPLSLIPWPRDGCPSENLAEVQHATAVLPIFSEVLSVAEEWAEIPRILIDLEQQQQRKQNSVENMDLPILSRELEVVGELAHELVRDISRAHPYAKLSRSAASRLSNSISSSALWVTRLWKEYWTTEARLWIPNVVDQLESAQTYLNFVASLDDDASNLFFYSSSIPPLSSLPSSPDLFQRRRLQGQVLGNSTNGTAGRLTVLNDCDALDRILDEYQHTIHDLGNGVCPFFANCAASDEDDSVHRALPELHPICHLPPSPWPPSSSPFNDAHRLATFLEAARKLNREDQETRDQSNSARPGLIKFEPMWPSQDVREPNIVAITRHMATISSDIAALLEVARSVGMWDPLQSPPPAGKTRGWEDAASRLAALSLSLSMEWELAAISSTVATRALCSRLSALSSTVHDLMEGNGWVSIELLATSSLQATKKGRRLCLQCSHHVNVTHGLLPHPLDQAEDAHVLMERLEHSARGFASELDRLVAAEDRDTEARLLTRREASAESVASALGVDPSLIIDIGPADYEEASGETGEKDDGFYATLKRGASRAGSVFGF